MNRYGNYRWSEVSQHRVCPHILVWEQYMQHPVPDDCCIHHLDGNKLNNDITNLVCMTKSEHSRWHNKGRTHTEEAKRKMKKALSEERKQDISKTMTKYIYYYDGKEINIKQEAERISISKGCLYERCRNNYEKYSRKPIEDDTPSV